MRRLISWILLNIFCRIPHANGSSEPFSRQVHQPLVGTTRTSPKDLRRSTPLLQVRGGAPDEEEDNDEERYSRQVYTLGARAHGLIRTASVFLDGPARSGLTFEAAKNLALSGIGRIVVVTSENEHDDNYHNENLDDLGRTYIRGARAELQLDDDDESISDTTILVEYLRRLNPSLKLDVVAREDLEQSDSKSGVLLCVDRPYETQLELNQLSRDMDFAFVSVETAGVYGRAFSDFGPTFEVHDSDGETPLVVPIHSVGKLEGEDGFFVLRSVEGERHDVSKGDEIVFQMPTGDKLDLSCIVSKVQTPESIIVKMKSSEGDDESFLRDVNERASTFSRIKSISKVSFAPLSDATARARNDPSLFTPCDLDKSFDDVRRGSVFGGFQALSAFVRDHSRLPTHIDQDKLLDMTRTEWPEIKDNPAHEQHCKMLTRTCAAKFVPLQAVFAAVAAQECLKASSGLYNPIKQFILYDCDEVIISSNEGENMNVDDAECGVAYILGDATYTALKNKRLFVVGSGAIGCEILKNLAAMGAGTGKEGSIIVTDMDTIERSNLSRQLLFRDGDISKFKSKAAEEAVARLNNKVKLECHTHKVGDDEAGPFKAKFWSKKVDIILNALDNVDARLYMDGQCVANQKALVDAGTLGSKGNVQVVVPRLSESYGSSVDPPEPAIPVCTLKNFPYLISHTIQWGRDLFDGLFVRRPKQSNNYAETLSKEGASALEAQLIRDHGDAAALETARELAVDIEAAVQALHGEDAKQKAIAWSIDLADELFYASVKKLLKEHPVDSLDEDGEPFWSGSRKIPVALEYVAGENVGSQQEIVNSNYIDFVRYSARLRLETYQGVELKSDIATEEVKDALLTCSKNFGGDEEDSVSNYLSPLVALDKPKNDLHVAEFEKDDETNGHIDFITAASNLRALCYGIPAVDAMETRRVAGRIVPAMITTTAFVSALSCTELCKLVQEAPLSRYRNAYINLALPFFAFTAPLPAEEMPGIGDQTFTLWDKLEIKESKKLAAKGGLTLGKFRKRILKKVGDGSESIQVSSISFGQYMIYASFLNEDDEELLGKNLWTVVKEAVESGNEFDLEFSRDVDSTSAGTSVAGIDDNTLDLTVLVEDFETGEEIELPPVRVTRTRTE